MPGALPAISELCAVLLAVVDGAGVDHVAIAVALVDEGALIVSIRPHSAPSVTATLAHGKAVTALRFRLDTTAWKGSHANLVERVAISEVPGFTPLAGGLPIQIFERLYWGVGVSGGSEAQDAQYARHARALIEELVGPQGPGRRLA